MSVVKVGVFAAVVGLCVLRIHAETPPTATVIGWPTLDLTGSGNGVLTGTTILYEEPDFLQVTKTIDTYLGVPYAETPVDDLRFADPVPHEIQGEYNATYDRAECPQPNPLGGLPSPPFPDVGRNIGEDCLYLSIYTPSPKPDTPVPVLVWFHGGAYIFGGGSEVLYEPYPIVALADIVVVNVNYRMGVFGFMTTGDDVATGNFGLMDQLEALKWIQTNIADFGGDPNRVTISGESAGGSSVSQHMLSPLSNGLFHGAILQSGNAISPWSWSTLDRAVKSHRGFAEFVGCPSSDSQAMVDCMRIIDWEVLQTRQGLYVNGSLASPVVDGHFLPDDPVEMIKRGQFQVLPSLMGSNIVEMELVALFFDLPDSFSVRPVMNISMFRALMPGSTYYIESPEEIAAVEQQYIDWTVADNATADQLDGYVRLMTDQSFACPTEYYARALEAAGADVYLYEMTHDPTYSIWFDIPKWTGAVHAEDLQFVFAWGLNPTMASTTTQTDEEKFMSIEVMRYWTNFVKSGNPNMPMGNSEYPDWPRYTMPEQEYKTLSLDMVNDRALRAADCAFWRNYIPKLHFQTAPIEDVYEDWKKHYGIWRDVDMPNWTTEFEKYKEGNTCSTPSP